MVGRGELTVKSSSSCRWSNIPLPEPHIVGLLASGVLHLARPWRLPGSRQLYSGAPLSYLLEGLLLLFGLSGDVGARGISGILGNGWR